MTLYKSGEFNTHLLTPISLDNLDFFFFFSLYTLNKCLILIRAELSSLDKIMECVREHGIEDCIIAGFVK